MARAGRLAVVALMFLAIAVPASAANVLTLPSEIHGTVAGSTVGDSYNPVAGSHWSGTVVLKRLSKYSTAYKLAAGTAIAWNATLAAPCSGAAHGTLGPKQLAGELLIDQPRWTIIIQPVPQQMPLSGTCPAADGTPVPFAHDATSPLLLNSLDKGHPEYAVTKDPQHFRGMGMSSTPFEGEGTLHMQWNLTAASSLKAVPRARGALRGGTALLDGSGSTPASQITSYKWRFHELPGACPAGASPHAAAHKTGRKVKIVVLCSVQAELTVTDAHGDSDTQSTTVPVRARKGKDWVTPFSHREKTGDPRTPQGTPQAIGEAFSSGDAGLNVSDCGTEIPGSLIVCPLLDGHTSWLDHGYALKRVHDRDGPFDGYFYVVNPSLSVKRAALISPNYLPGSTFYEYNKAKTPPDADLLGFLKAVRAHEGLGGSAPGTGHSQIMRTLVAQAANNPRLLIESDFGPSRAAAAAAADKHLHEVDARIDTASADPLPDIFVGPIWAYDGYTHAWKRFPAVRVPGNVP
jgi:hypothetical protein